MQGGPRKSAKRLATLALAAAMLGLSGCAEIIRNHGYTPTEDVLLEIIPGIDTRGTVEDVVGKPSTSGVLEEGAWYYVGSKVRHFGLRKPQEVSREVVAITFNEDQTVSNIERFGLEDGRVVTLSRRVTETTVRDVTFIRQIIRNFGRIDLGEALDN